MYTKQILDCAFFFFRLYIFFNSNVATVIASSVNVPHLVAWPEKKNLLE